jgi:sulfite reductase (NADPH) flavoprotein alpha-component
MSDMKLTIVYGSETGNSRGLANQVAKRAAKNGVQATVHDMAAYTPAQLAAEQDPVLLVVSTWDDGLPPMKARKFFKALEDSAPSLSGVRFAVLALGDSEYPAYCQAGKDLDARLEALGATRLVSRGDLGADFQVSYIGWAKNFWKTMAGVYGIAA